MMRFFERRKAAYQAFVGKQQDLLRNLPGLAMGFSKEEKLRTRLLLKKSGDYFFPCSMRCTPSL